MPPNWHEPIHAAETKRTVSISCLATTRQHRKQENLFLKQPKPICTAFERGCTQTPDTHTGMQVDYSDEVVLLRELRSIESDASPLHE